MSADRLHQATYASARWSTGLWNPLRGTGSKKGGRSTIIRYLTIRKTTETNKCDAFFLSIFPGLPNNLLNYIKILIKFHCWIRPQINLMENHSPCRRHQLCRERKLSHRYFCSHQRTDQFGNSIVGTTCFWVVLLLQH